MIQAKQELLAALQAAVTELSPDAAFTPAFESPKQAAHGDLACTAAMQLARPMKKNPRELAQALIDALNRQSAVQRWVDAMDIAGPGFINLRLKAAAKQASAQSAPMQSATPGPGGASSIKRLEAKGDVIVTQKD